MKSGRAYIGIFQKMHIKNLRGGEGSMMSDLKKLDSFTLKTSKNHLIRNFLRNWRLRVKPKSDPNFKPTADPYLISRAETELTKFREKI